ncbi:hypothetical protein INT48_003347 [Thamnidium elegans]|uniref:Endoplasmic reticulum transmembrane protein n=1 Tax=Thamnidium elegans TaxID=101142 RepID=A0A8H7SKG0_9FUNG|nr:hypothetical protein INT48_003347 [Thamnidium elegans]
MALYYGIVFAILTLEVLTFFLFLLPIPTRWQKPVFRWLATSPSIAHAQYIMKVVFAFIFVLFLDAANTLKAFYEVVNAEEENPAAALGSTDFRAQVGQAAKKFYAQRNLYLTGFTMLLLLLEDELIELEGVTSKDPLVREASSHIDTDPIESKVTKLEPVQQENENKKDL